MIKQKTVYFIRHGQSSQNAEPMFQGLDPDLSSLGREQARLIAKRLKSHKVDALISSPLPRAKQTAEAISETTGRGIEFSRLFVERIKPSRINNKPFTDQEATDLWHKWHNAFYSTSEKIEDGENYYDIVNRADLALDYLLKRDEENIYVVTHGYFLRVLVARAILGDSFDARALKNFQRVQSNENTGVTIMKYYADFEEDEAWHLVTYNDFSHL